VFDVYIYLTFSKHALSSYFFCKRSFISWSNNPLNWKGVQVTESYRNAVSLKWLHCRFCFINKRRGAEFFHKITKVLDHNTAIRFSFFLQLDLVYKLTSCCIIILYCAVVYSFVLWHSDRRRVIRFKWKQLVHADNHRIYIIGGLHHNNA
jgi:hypothetical protein